jgi:5-methylcytosine-specific restriction endonuclease McrA
MAERYANRVLIGTCVDCGKKSAEKDSVRCSICIKSHANYQKQYLDSKFFLRRSYGPSLAGPKRPHTAKILASLWREQKGICALTGLKLTRENAEVDHIHPRAKGGEVTKDNLRWVLKEANRAKQTLSDEEFLYLCAAVVVHAETKNQ